MTAPGTSRRYRYPVDTSAVEGRAARSWWRTAFSVHRECLDHVVIFNERHLGRILSSYAGYYHRSRTHLALNKDCPDVRPIEPPAAGRIIASPQVGGLHHCYERLAA
jgi:hypothetical protein